MSILGTLGKIASMAGEIIGGLVKGSGKKAPQPVDPPPEDQHLRDNREIEERIRRGDL